jgi:hypothetical protein
MAPVLRQPVRDTVVATFAARCANEKGHDWTQIRLAPKHARQRTIVEVAVVDLHRNVVVPRDDWPEVSKCRVR